MDNKKENTKESISDDGIRDELARKFKEGYQTKGDVRPALNRGENLEDDEDVKDFLEQKNGREEEASSEDFFQPVQPGSKISYTWTIILVILILISLTTVVVLVIKNGTANQSEVSEYEKISVFNKQKAKYDQSFVNATNKLIEAENSFNNNDFAVADKTAQEAEDLYSESLDDLDNLQILQMGDSYNFLSDYYDDLDEASSLGGDMASDLAYAARSADRSEVSEAAKSLSKYQSAAGDFDDLLKDIEKIKKSNSDFF